MNVDPLPSSLATCTVPSISWTSCGPWSAPARHRSMPAVGSGGEGIEHGTELRRRDADPVVVHLEQQPALAHGTYPDGDRAARAANLIPLSTRFTSTWRRREESTCTMAAIRN